MIKKWIVRLFSLKKDAKGVDDMNIRYLNLSVFVVPFFLLLQGTPFMQTWTLLNSPGRINAEPNREERRDNSGPVYRTSQTVIGQIGVSKETVRTVTAYNVGDSRQTHSRPYIGAGGDNLCSLVKKGIKVCAANFVPLRSRLHVDKIGECVVLDRMNTRFGGRVDFAMNKDQYHRAVKFGAQRLVVTKSEDQRKGR